MVNVGSWGRLGSWPHDVRPLTEHGLPTLPLAPGRQGLAYGMGRSYGDVCLNPGGTLWTTPGLDRFLAFDKEQGLLTCEAGVLLRDIQRTFLPRGWMLAVTPGTQVVTVGGAIANDVHGKNHHVRGSFGDHVTHLRLLRTDGTVIECGPDRHADWFAATVGGLGLTGVIAQATLRLIQVPGPWLDVESIPYESLEEFFALADSSEAGWEYTVSWVDCMHGEGARGIFMRGNMSDSTGGRAPPDHARTVPFAPPVSLVNRFSVRPFNWVYYHHHRQRAGRQRVHYVPFFYPLDHLLEWNRVYGRPGFYQYQCVLPRAAGLAGTQGLLREIAASGEGSFLAVLKTFSERAAPGMLSFARPGVTLALDFPNHGDATLRLFDRLDAVVREAGGRIYPAKDARMPRDLFESGYPRLAEFLPFRDPGIRSAFAQRVMPASPD
ncbi:FAD-binding oxidoreductase [Caenimonas sedimenti]|uniref:Delta(24)-sterol reductase n=1 Tax=Caenimonas sedimenti TaxID=2596921 RepID=A0A562ZQB6_9BURK|nr:FAD-binding oxidoreductase [Caenimonas sedimenti]TWO70546.1 FAD-binding oxidoreductase [Caenimonas sedimenti]